VLGTLGYGAVIVLAALAVPGLSKWFTAPLIPPLAIILIVAAALIVATILITDLRASAARARVEIEGLKAINSNLESEMSQLRIAAFHDMLTGVPNSRFLKRLLSEERNDRDNLCLILLDIENFGDINKRHNHWKGDAYLSNFASMILQNSRRDEYVIKRRPGVEDADSLEIQAFRRYSGGDEFYILVRGSVADGLGYLMRLWRRAKEFDAMAVKVLGSPHRFGFRAGLVSIGKEDNYDTAAENVAIVLGMAKEVPTARLFWRQEDVQWLPERENDLVLQAIAQFGNPYVKPYQDWQPVLF
jgi:GGDEF domain-containing protein